MLDPLTTLSAASNVAQFIDLVIKVVGKSRDIRNSASGILDEHKHLEDVTKDLATLTAKLQKSLTVPDVPTCLKADEQALSDLCSGCLEVSSQLAAALSRLKGKGNLGTFRSLRQALKCVWNKDDVDHLEKTVRVYRDELNTRVLVGLRGNVNALISEQSKSFASLDESAQRMIQSLNSVHTETQIKLHKQDEHAEALHSHTVTVVGKHALEVINGQDALLQQVNHISEQTDLSTREILDAQSHTSTATERWMNQNLAEHQGTRDEMQIFKEQAETQVATLTEEIRQLKIELEASVKQMAMSIGSVSKKKQREMKEISNAKYALWVAKEVILEKLKAFLALFRFDFAAHVQAIAAEKTWKLLPYPKPQDAMTTNATRPPVDMSFGTKETSLAWATTYHNMRYSIAARNVPLVRTLLDQGADPNARSPVDGSETLLHVAVASAYEFTSADTISSIVPMRRCAIEMIRLLLEYGACADLDGINHGRIVNIRIANANNERTSKLKQISQKRYDVFESIAFESPFLYPLEKMDWVIQQLLSASPHPYFREILYLTDAVWSGNLEGANTILNPTGPMIPNSGVCTRADGFGASSLGAAVFCGDKSMVKLLLEHGADPNLPDATGFLPLAIAAYCRNESIIDLLVNSGADSALTDHPTLQATMIEHSIDDSYALCELLVKGYSSSSRSVLISKDIDLLNGMLARAVRSYEPDLVQLFLNYGAAADVGLKDLDDMTPWRFLSSRLEGNHLHWYQDREEIRKLYRTLRVVESNHGGPATSVRVCQLWEPGLEGPARVCQLWERGLEGSV